MFLFEDNEGEAFVMQIQVRDNDEWKRLLESIEKRTNVFTPKFRLEEVGDGVFNIYTEERWKKWVREFILFVLEVEGIRHKAPEPQLTTYSTPIPRKKVRTPLSNTYR